MTQHVTNQDWLYPFMTYRCAFPPHGVVWYFNTRQPINLDTINTHDDLLDLTVEMKPGTTIEATNNWRSTLQKFCPAKTSMQ